MGRTQRCVHKKCSEKRLNTDCEQNEENCRKLSKNLLSSSGMTRSFDIPLKTGSSDWHPSLRTLRRQCLPCSKTSAHPCRSAEIPGTYAAASKIPSR